MKNFIKKSVLFLGILASIGVVLFVFEKDRDGSLEYMAAMNDKHERIKTINSPKIILAGGSNLVFGIDSQKIEKELGAPVVNLGLHAQLGLTFMLNELRDVASSGDFVVLSIEHSVNLKGNRNLHALTSYYYPTARKYYSESSSEFESVLEKTHMLYKKTVSKLITNMKKDEVYTRDGFNEYGDGVNHLELPSSPTLGSKSIIKNNKANEIKALNDFYQYAQKNHISMVFSYGAYEESEYVKNKKELMSMNETFKRELQMKVISDVETFVYPTDYFFDSVYHLNGKGRQVHTAKLIEILNQEVKINSEHGKLAIVSVDFD